MSNHVLNAAQAAVPLPTVSTPRRWLKALDRGLISVVEVCAALLLAVEIVVCWRAWYRATRCINLWCGRMNWPASCSFGSRC